MQAKRKLLQINTVVNYGSTGRIAEEIGKAALADGWESYIAYGRYERPSKSELIRIGTTPDILLHGLQTRLFDRHGLASHRATKKLVEKIESISPDIIHLHNLHGYYLNYQVLFEYLSAIDTPVVWTLHDCWPFTGHCAHFDFVGCDKWLAVCYHCPQKKRYPASLLLDGSQRNHVLKKQSFTSAGNMVIVPVSEWQEKLAKKSFLAEFPIQTIHNGIDTNKFSPAAVKEVRYKYKVNNRFMILGVASVWEERKGFGDFLQLARMLDDDCRIVLVGLDKKRLKHLPANVIGIQRTENIHELAKLYSVADVFVNPTWEDNFPTTNLEALACGTPVITYDTGGSIEAIDPDTGYVVKKGDVYGLGEAIDEIRKNGKHYYSALCRQRALKLFRKEDRFAEYLKLYESLQHTRH